MKRHCLGILVMALGLMSVEAQAQAQEQLKPYRSAPHRQPPVARNLSPRLETYFRNTSPKLLEDFGEQYIYADANAALDKTVAHRVVFLGDSITDMWNLAALFPGKPYVNRGISGQVTPQMLLRFHADVIALKPEAVVILAGVNDIDSVLQIMSEAQTEANYEAMAELATAHGIRPVFSKILPRRASEAHPDPRFAEKEQARQRINAWLEALCHERGYGLIDYTSVLSDGEGAFRADLTDDGTHPNAQGFAVMTPVAAQVLNNLVGTD